MPSKIDHAPKAHAIVVAAGHGARMGGGQWKQFRLIGSRPVVAWTMEMLDRSRSVDGITLVVPSVFESRSFKLPDITGIKKLRTVVAGGRSRQESVRLGLAKVSSLSGLVLVHDGVRPFVTVELIDRVVAGGAETGAAVCAVPASDTVKEVGADGIVVKTLDRGRLWMVQTPQAFRQGLLCTAHEQALADGYAGTDDAELVERLGVAVRVVEGDPANVKLTSPQDFAWAESVLAQRRKEGRGPGQSAGEEGT